MTREARPERPSGIETDPVKMAGSGEMPVQETKVQKGRGGGSGNENKRSTEHQPYVRGRGDCAQQKAAKKVGALATGLRRENSIRRHVRWSGGGNVRKGRASGKAKCIRRGRGQGTGKSARTM